MYVACGADKALSLWCDYIRDSSVVQVGWGIGSINYSSDMPESAYVEDNSYGVYGQDVGKNTSLKSWVDFLMTYDNIDAFQLCLAVQTWKVYAIDRRGVIRKSYPLNQLFT